MRFQRIYIEITNVCNLHCSFCAKSKRSPQFMSTAQFTHILNEIQPYCAYIYLHVLGEPLLHPQLKKLLKLAKQKGFFVNLTTNATLLPQQLKILIGHVRQLNLSLHAELEQKNHYLQDCLSCGDELAEHGTYVSYRFWNRGKQGFDPSSERMLYELASHYGISDFKAESQKLADFRFLHIEAPFVWPSLTHSPLTTAGSCYGLRRQCAILVDGSVVPCCLDGEGGCVLGNIYEEDFALILQKQRTRAMIAGFQQGKLYDPLCQRCHYRTRFDKEELCLSN